MTKTLLSIFDATGQWSRPYALAGYDVIQIDIQHDPELHDIRNFCVEYLVEKLQIDTVDGIIGAPPCTDFANSGAQYWPAKDRDGRTANSVEIMLQLLRCVEYFKPDFFCFENPIGRLPKLIPHIGTPFRFDPSDFAGYQDPYLSDEDLATLREMETRHTRGLKFSKDEIQLVKESNRYTKRTCLWGRFIHPATNPRPAIRVSNQGSWLQTLGGISSSTKNARSETPAGFAQAFFEANNHGEKQTRTWAAERAAEWIAEQHSDAPHELTDLEVISLLDVDEHPDADPHETLTAFRRIYQSGRQHPYGIAFNP